MDSTMCWSQGHPSHGGASCPTIKNHSVTYFCNHLYCFGGYDGRRNHATLLVYSLKEERWIRPHSGVAEAPSLYWGTADCRYVVQGNPPPGRNGHSATLAVEGPDRAKIVIIGGWLGTGPLAASDVHILTISENGYRMEWSQPPEIHESTPPGPCNMHSADYVSSRQSVYVFRGGNGREYLNDLHALHVPTMKWAQVETTGQRPQQRANHSSAVLESTQELFVFGGWNGKSRLNDIYILDTENHTWSCPQVNGVLPHPRAGMTLTAIRNRLYLFGGSGTSAKCFDDLQIFDRDTMSWLDVSAASESHTVAAVSPSMYPDNDGVGWSSQDGGTPPETTQANPNDQDTVPSVWLQGTGPGRRAGHTSTAVHRQIFVFGGSCGSDYLNDFFTLDTDPPPTLSVTEAPTLDLVTRRLPHFCNDPEFSDVTFVVQGRQVYGHKMVLSIVSDCFRAMFTGGFREANQDEIVIPDATYQGFCAVLEYIYSGHVRLCEDNVVELLELADRFFLNHLKQVCECRLQDEVNSETVDYLLGVAVKTNSVQLEHVCQHFLRNHHLLAPDPSPPAREGGGGES